MNTWRILVIVAAVDIFVAADAFADRYITAEQARQFAIVMPKPVYPESARHHSIDGSGVFKLYVHAKTGQLKSVKVLRSTRNGELDAAAKWALLQWRFKPGVL